MTLPNFICIARLFAVPALAWTLILGDWVSAFAIFVAAGISDGIDGFIARRFNQESELGRHLDPLADKALLVTAFLALGLLGRLPDWLVVLVISRDLFIVAGVLLAYVMDQPIRVRPLIVSKANTFAQIALAGFALAEPAMGLVLDHAIDALVFVSALLTLASAATYAFVWLRHMAQGERRPPPDQSGFK